jgi:hypothetical protein
MNFCRMKRRRDDRSGIALIVTLAIVALITITVVAYLSRTITNRRIVAATSGGVRADVLARAAAQIILADTKREIAGGSEVFNPSPDQATIYRPIAAAYVVPYRALVQASMLTDSTFNNLVKQSGSPFFPIGGYTTQPQLTAATGHTTDVAATNGRTVGITRWNAPILNSNNGFSSVDQLPQWILVDRTGVAPSQSWAASMRDYTPGNDRAVIGRFAFNAYDIGGILDANVAGYPLFTTPLSIPQIQELKSTEAGAAFFDSSGAIIPDFDQTKQQTFVNSWKFGTAGTSNSANFFLDFMSRTTPPNNTISPTMAESGFMRPTVRDPSSSSSDSNTIAYSREDLIRLTQASNVYLTTSALPYFTHFSRELNTPSWSPGQDASTLGGNNGQTNAFAYFTNRDNPSSANRFVPNARVAVVFTRSDGTQAVIGDPLIKNRFPLRRIDGLGNANTWWSTGSNTSAFPVLVSGSLQYPTRNTIQRDFGLIWNATANRWDYVGSSGTAVQNSIATLDQVAAAGREPNFFEVLKAFILSGSVGLGTDNSGAGRTFVNAESRYYQQPLSSDAQIIQIGANIIDQWDSDNNPTFVFFGSDEFAGIENLPYLNKIMFQPRWTSSTQFAAWLVPSFWTPAQNGTSVGTQSPTIPAIRFVMTSGSAYAVVEGSGTPTPSIISSTVTGTAAAPSVNLTASHDFSSPPDAASSSTTTKNGMTSAGNSRLGIPFTFPAGGAVSKGTTTRAYPVLNAATFEMQAQIGGSSGPWKTYQRWNGCSVNNSAITAACQPAAGFDWTSSTIYDPEFVLLDPRIMRFGVWETDGALSGDSSDFNRGFNETLDRGSGSNEFQKVTGLGPLGASHFTGVGPEMANNTSAPPNYSDLDGVIRKGDVLTSGAASAMLPSDTADRPSIVSRQIRTVAELGTVSRDQPWKTLNFLTSDSADAGLLDAFSIFEPNSVFESDITAGKISLNTRQAPVLRAILNGTALQTNTSSTTPLITAAQRDQIVDALIQMTSTQPMINKSELVTRFAADSSVASLGNKEAREAVIRALSDVGQTRTWNLMIDVIAQSGRYGPNAANVDNFIVEGEKRYWFHVAIDRFTGEVVDQQLEAVHE